jgi:hypothetical protein
VNFSPVAYEQPARPNSNSFGLPSEPPTHSEDAIWRWGGYCACIACKPPGGTVAAGPLLRRFTWAPSPEQRHMATLASDPPHRRSAFTPKSTTSLRSTIPCLRRASLRDGPRAGHEGGGSPGCAGIPSRRRRKRSGPPTRRDTRFRIPVLRSRQPTSCCPRAVSSGQQRSPTAHRGTRHPQLSGHHLAR